MTPKRGMQFLHKRVIEADTHKPMLYVVTRIARGVVYYKPVNGGHSECTEIENFDKVVLTLIQ